MPKRKADKRRTARPRQSQQLSPNLLDQANTAIRATLEFQEDLFGSWSDFIQQSAQINGWQRRSQAAIVDLIPAFQSSLSAFVDLMDVGSRTSVDLLRKTVDAASASRTALEASEKTQQLAQGSAQAVLSGAQALASAGRRTFESWARAMGDTWQAGTAAANAAQEIGRLSADTTRRARKASSRAADRFAQTAANAAGAVTRSAAQAAEQSARTSASAA